MSDILIAGASGKIGYELLKTLNYSSIGTFFNEVKDIKITYSYDKIPLGAGGAIRAALKKSKNKNIIVINGDTYFDISLKKLINKHITDNNDITLSLKPMSNFSRYGVVDTEKNGNVIRFKEKEYRQNGNINGGIYIIKNTVFNDYKGNDSFLFSEFIENNIIHLKIGSVIFDGLFIDIGTPEDFLYAQKVLKEVITI